MGTSYAFVQTDLVSQQNKESATAEKEKHYG